MTTNEKTLLYDKVAEALESEDTRKVVKTLDDIHAKNSKNRLDLSLPFRSMTLLHVAVGFSQNDPLFVKLFIEHPLCYNANPNIKSCSEEEMTPLHIAVSFDFQNTLAYLISIGGDPCIKAGNSKTAFHMAVDNVVNSLQENCFEYLYRKFVSFRKSTSMHEMRKSIRRSFSITDGKQLNDLDSFVRNEQLCASEDFSQEKHCPTKPDSKVTRVLVNLENLAEEEEEYFETTMTLAAPEQPEQKTDMQHGAKNGNIKVTITTASVPFNAFLSNNIPQSQGISDISPYETLNMNSFEVHTVEEPSEFSKDFEVSRSRRRLFPSPELVPPVKERPTHYRDWANSKYTSYSTASSDISSITSSFKALLTDDDSLSDKVAPNVHPQSGVNGRLQTLLEESNGSSGLLCNHAEVKSPTKRELQDLGKNTLVRKANIPITMSTYNIISNIVDSPDKRHLLQQQPRLKYSTELTQALQNSHFLHEWRSLKVDLILEENKVRTPVSKSFFNYVLLDPKILRKANFSGNVFKSSVINDRKKFEVFLSAIFYIGKGHGKRPLHHLVEAKEKYSERRKKSKIPCATTELEHRDKVSRIVDIWEHGLGVVVHQIFPFSSQQEASANEAAMIDAIGIGVSGLCNQIKGSFQGTVCQKWPQKIKNQLGTVLLHNTFCNFVVSEKKTFEPKDI